MNEDRGAETGEERVVKNQLQRCVTIWASLNTHNKYTLILKCQIKG